MKNALGFICGMWNLRPSLLKPFSTLHLISQSLSLNTIGSFPAFRPRFAGKYDRQSSDLTQFTSGYNFAVEPTTNHPRSS